MKEIFDKTTKLLDFINENKIVNQSFICFTLFFIPNEFQQQYGLNFEILPSDIKHDFL